MVATKMDPELFILKHNEGMTAKELASLFGVSKRTVQRWRERYGLAEPCSVFLNGKPTQQERIQQFRDAAEDGWPLIEMVRTFNATPRTVKKYTGGYKGVTKREAGSLNRFRIAMAQKAEKNNVDLWDLVKSE